LQRHLATFKTNLVKAASPRLLTLVAAAGRLSEASADAAPHAASRPRTPRGRFQRIEPHDVIPSMWRKRPFPVTPI
jgi:hypothetical protein